MIKIIEDIDITTLGVSVYNRKWQPIHLQQGEMDGACAVYSMMMNLLVLKVFTRSQVVNLNTTFKGNTAKGRLFKEFFVTEAVCWNAIAADGYKLRWYQEPIYYCEYLEDGLTKTGANDLRGHLENFQGFCFYIRQCLTVKNRLESYQDFVDFEKTCDVMGLGETERANALHWSRTVYRIKKRLIMPAIHNIKRLIYISQRLRSFSTR